MNSSYDLQVPFSLRGLDGVIDVSITENVDPDAVGYALIAAGRPAELARGFPVCSASVTYPAQGYACVFGWTQMVRSTDGGSDDFEMDPIAIYADVATPFAWYGLEPRLFDAPFRETRDALVWRARSFLCVSPDAVVTRQVKAVTGIGWGFDIVNGAIEIIPPLILEETQWDEQLTLLATSYPEWKFDRGFSTS
jgi:hypothetical protein